MTRLYHRLGGPAPVPVEVRFWSKVDKSGGCWLWKGATTDGYGSFYRARGDNTGIAHRFAYELLVGPIPDDRPHLDHLCHNADLSCRGGTQCLHRLCVNPAHLDPVTNTENIRRAPYMTRPTCPRGHPRTPENVRVWTTRQGWLRHACRPCAQRTWRAWKARHLAVA